MGIPKEPVVFLKAPSALCRPNDDVIIPRGSLRTDWEVELAVVIGVRASYVTTAEAMDYIAGYCLHNDYSHGDPDLKRLGYLSWRMDGATSANDGSQHTCTNDCDRRSQFCRVFSSWGESGLGERTFRNDYDAQAVSL